MQIFGIVNSPLQCCGEPVASSGIHATTALAEVLVLMASVRCRTNPKKDATPRTPTIQHHKNCCTFPLQGVRALWNAPYDSDPPPACHFGPRSVITQKLDVINDVQKPLRKEPASQVPNESYDST
ncbi:hypothetical protein MRX96_055568 [Rhipicephalus microplus]